MTIQQQLRRRDFLKIIVVCWLLLLVGLLPTACDKTDKYYDVLLNEPELWARKTYDEVYGIGDTITLYGRLRADDLTIRVGDADAPIVERITLPNDLSEGYAVQRVKVVVTQAMGVGRKRPVSISAHGLTIRGLDIEILENSSKATLPAGLTVEKLADYPQNSIVVHCHSGTGNIFFMDTTTVTLTRIAPDGTQKQWAFNEQVLKDADGAAFAVTRVNGGGIDPAERYLYLSLYSEAPRRTYYHYYRFCRYNLQDGTLQVLNKTPYHIYRYQRTLETLQPFEGNFAEVKFFNATGIYPDNTGKVYVNMNNRLIARLEPDGTFTYLYKNTNLNLSSNKIVNDDAPQVYEEANDGYKDDQYLRQNVWKGKDLLYVRVDALDVERDIFYLQTRQQSTLSATSGQILRTITPYNLRTLEAGNVFSRRTSDGRSGKPFSIGSFDVLNYSLAQQHTNALFGLFPLNGQLLLLKFQNLLIDPRYEGGYPVPAWALMDFENRQGQFYALGAFDPKGHVMYDSAGTGEKTISDYDLMLNFDPQGMLYMTANKRTVILKTTYK